MLIRFSRNNLSHAFAGQAVGIKEVAEKIWLVTFMHYDLGFFDHETRRVECAPNPFEAQVLPMSPESNVTYVTGIDPLIDGAPGEIRTPDLMVRSHRSPASKLPVIQSTYRTRSVLFNAQPRAARHLIMCSPEFANSSQPRLTLNALADCSSISIINS